MMIPFRPPTNRRHTIACVLSSADCSTIVNEPIKINSYDENERPSSSSTTALKEDDRGELTIIRRPYSGQQETEGEFVAATGPPASGESLYSSSSHSFYVSPPSSLFSPTTCLASSSSPALLRPRVAPYSKSSSSSSDIFIDYYPPAAVDPAAACCSSSLSAAAARRHMYPHFADSDADAVYGGAAAAAASVGVSSADGESEALIFRTISCPAGREQREDVDDDSSTRHYQQERLRLKSCSDAVPSSSSGVRYNTVQTANGHHYIANNVNNKKGSRITTFNLNLTYIPPITPRMSCTSNGGGDCNSPNNHQNHSKKKHNHHQRQHQLISTSDSVMTVEQLKMARERTREKVRRIVVCVSVTLTLIAVLLVTSFLALGSKLEHHENTQPDPSNTSPFARDPVRPSSSSNVGTENVVLSSSDAAAANSSANPTIAYSNGSNHRLLMKLGRKEKREVGESK